MRTSILYNIPNVAVLGRNEDLASDRDMEIIPGLVAEELSSRGFSVTLVAADRNLIPAVRDHAPRIVLNLAE